MTDLRLVPAGLLVWLACVLVVGATPAAAAGVAAALAVVAAAAALRGAPPTAWLAVAAAALACGSCALQLHQRASGPLVPLAADRAAVTLEGVVRGEPACTGGAGCRPRVVVAADAVVGRGGRGEVAARVLATGPVEYLAHGARVRLVGRLAPADPGDDVAAVLRLGAPPAVVRPPAGVDAAVGRVRGALLAATDAMPPDLRGLVPGAAIGDTSRIPPDLDRAMRDVSLTHITAVSGSHFAVLATAVAALGSALALPRLARALLTAVAMAGFVLLVHPQPSVVRAAVMGAVAVAGVVAGRPARSVPALGAAVTGLLVLDPWLARSYGFVLSVAATAAIALLAPVLAARLQVVLPRWLALAVAVPAAAQAACGPVIVLLEPAVSPYAVLANLLAAPALFPATVLGVAGALLAPWLPGVAAPLLDGGAAACWWIATVARVTADLPGARVPWPGGAGGASLLALATAAGLALALRRRRRPLARPVVALALALAVAVPVLRWAAQPRWVPDGWRVVQCDVGQGDTLVVRSGEGAAVVVDVGPPGRAADACLRRLGVRRIDLLVLTHFHADHVGGLPAVLAGREVAAALVSPLAEPAGQAREARAALVAAGATVSAAGEGAARGQAGEVAWRVLGPPPGAVEPNDASVVVLLAVDGVTVLALGDAEIAAQDALAARLAGDPRARSATVVKVAHHGSATQSRRLAGLLAPAVALVPVGRDNEYGHPAPATVDLYRDRGALVLATDTCGPVAIAADDGALEVTARCLGR